MFPIETPFGHHKTIVPTTGVVMCTSGRTFEHDRYEEAADECTMLTSRPHAERDINVTFLPLFPWLNNNFNKI